jgi:hypothetical protein
MRDFADWIATCRRYEKEHRDAGNLAGAEYHRGGAEAYERSAAYARPIATFLWDLLDDIDTANDRAKGNDALFREIVNRLQRRRFEIGSTNGYDLILF